ncbi:hypothetical protein [Dyadobacter sp. LHD-138]|uniref:hypothetical protein n=1 Tax=Dyadobacter sp. LHD-138 TaxID=3071413 RepID=UPI0027E08489|nr:hypothetical protein [Dyadobacter sp. LHD-138]MDQ6480592.1 hypothetical protein [Dyadobacter sp. LHD-138]
MIRELLELSTEGKQFVLDASDTAVSLQESYKQLIGAEKLTIADVINKIIAYHEQLQEEQGGYDSE